MSILVPLDLSEVGSCAIPVATDLATALNEDLVLLTVIDDKLSHEVEVLSKVDRDGATALVRARLDEVVSGFDAGVRIRSEVVTAATATRAIIERAAEEDIDMIVIASNGRSGISRVLMGSVAEDVTRRSSVPVMVVPARGRDCV